VKHEYDTAVQRQNELQATFFANNKAAHGILIRLEALSDLSNGNLTVTTARLLLFLLFLVIECLPVTVKLLQRPSLYEEGLQHAREAERRDVASYYRHRRRLGSGPQGTAQLWPGLGTSHDARIDAIWTPPRPMLQGAVVSEDDQGTEDLYGSAESSLPGGRAGFGSAGSPAAGAAGGDRSEQSWYGADRWLNHWQHQPAEDSEPRAEDSDGIGYDAGRDDFMPGPSTEAYDGEGLYDTGEYQDDGYGDDSLDDPDSADDARGGDRASWAPSAQESTPAAVPSGGGGGGGGTPLDWGDEE
jgi:hypothetical protein